MSGRDHVKPAATPGTPAGLKLTYDDFVLFPDEQAGDGFGRPLERSRETGDALTTASLPGHELPLARIFRE